MAITVETLKEFALDNGANLVGVAPVERFDAAPAGNQPEDILPGARAVVACARRIPYGELDSPPQPTTGQWRSSTCGWTNWPSRLPFSWTKMVGTPSPCLPTSLTASGKRKGIMAEFLSLTAMVVGMLPASS